MERLASQFGFADVDPGLLYRTLRLLERDGFVESTWVTEGQGPARRTYRVTVEGTEYLRAWANQLQRMREEMDRFLVIYHSSESTEKES
jgi:poly-beta-hydroxybutyrate-responsive repressor